MLCTNWLCNIVKLDVDLGILVFVSFTIKCMLFMDFCVFISSLSTEVALHTFDDFYKSIRVFFLPVCKELKLPPNSSSKQF